MPASEAQANATQSDAPSEHQRLLDLERNQAKLNNRIVALENRASRLETRNTRLTQQLAAVTGPKGILARLINQLRTIKGQSAYLERALFGDAPSRNGSPMAGRISGAKGAGETLARNGPSPNAMVAAHPTPRPKHTIVTSMARSASEPSATKTPGAAASKDTGTH